MLFSLTMMYQVHITSISWWNIFENPHDDILETQTNNFIWIVDETDGKCLGGHGFGECGPLNLWEIWGLDGAYTLEHHVDSALETIDSECLGRNVKWLAKTKAGLVKCSKSIILQWNFSLSSGQLSNGPGSKQCLRRVGNDAFIQPCSKGYTAVVPLIFDQQMYSSHKDDSTVIGQTQDADELLSDWTSPETGLILPRTLNDRLHNPSISNNNKAAAVIDTQNSQQLMGGGTYIHTVFNMNFKVYTVAWYIDVNRAYTSLSLQSFHHKSANDLVSSADFYKAISSSADYDKSILVKLAMPLKTETLVQGLVKEMLLKPEHSALFAQISKKYKKEECERGLELLFTYRAPTHKSGPNGSIFEIRIDGQLLDTIPNAALLAEDFFWQFVGDDPVSASAKARFADNFPLVLSGVYANDNSRSSKSRDSNGDSAAASLHESQSAISKHNSLSLDVTRSKSSFLPNVASKHHHLRTQAPLSDIASTLSSLGASNSQSIVKPVHVVIPTLSETIARQASLVQNKSTTSSNTKTPNAFYSSPSRHSATRRSSLTTKGRGRGLFRTSQDHFSRRLVGGVLLHQSLLKLNQTKFLKLKSVITQEIIFTIFIISYFGILFLLSLPAVRMRIREVKVKVKAAVKLVTSKSTGALVRIASSAKRRSSNALARITSTAKISKLASSQSMRQLYQIAFENCRRSTGASGSCSGI